MQVTNIVCKIPFDIPTQFQFVTSYRGNTILIQKGGATVFVRKESIEEIFFEIHLARDLSEFLCSIFPIEPVVYAVPRISQIVGVKTLTEARRTKKGLTSFLKKVHQICEIEHIEIHQGDINDITIWHMQNIEEETSGGIEKISFRFIFFRSKHKLTGKVQISREKLAYSITFVVSEFGEQIRNLIHFLHTQK